MVTTDRFNYRFNNSVAVVETQWFTAKETWVIVV